ncbi:type VI secretion system protein TssA [Shimwellia pseudoproteus]|uniref:type VI secretion system protein TssA n=1 Tax=Shimwellia pseudoproteus TaxID=570012 RepID=UPI0018EC36B0|nr:type VI secretion system protein TssA [Shimwellia pseudoproteus]MBJ3816983.1 type VI secretion system protein TssA [Shimwellia pseudoproteus]
MAKLRHLIHACGADEKILLREAQLQHAVWEGWLRPLDGTTLAGDDPVYYDAFRGIREEVNKLSGIDTERICRLSEALLLSISKDLRVITFYIWARLHQDGEAGFAQGIALLSAMLERFGTLLYPLRAQSRKAALEWLSSKRMTDSLSMYPEVDMSMMQRIAGGLLLSEQIFQTFDEDERPDLGPLYQALDNRLAQSGGATCLVPQTSREGNGPAASAPSTPEINAITSGRDLLDQARVLATYLREQTDGWLAGHHLLKSVRWDTLTALPPLDAAGRTRLDPPRPDSRAQLKRLYLQKNWPELLAYTDTLFAQGVNHLWLDVQWYTWQALIQSDADTVRATIICHDLNGLLSRLPGLASLAFSDGTPFADEVTLNWLNQTVLDDMPEWQAAPVAASAEDVLILEPEVLARADGEGIEAALSWLQVQPGYTASRDQWLMRLLMARVSEQYGKNEMALHLLAALDTSAGVLTLAQWAPALVFEVKARRGFVE